MPTIAARIKKARLDAKLTQTQLGAACGVTPQAVYAWETAKGASDYVALRTIAQVTATTLEWLISGQNAADNSTSDNKSATQWVGRVVPSLEWQEILPFVNNGLRPDATARSHFSCGPRSFQTVVIDKSNDPHISRGDSVIVDPDLKPVPGDIVLIDHAGDLYLRRYRPRDDHIELAPANLDWPSLKLSPEQARIVGVVAETSRPRRV